jgi:hypothetical protein
VRFRTFSRARAANRAKKKLFPFVVAVAVLTVGGISVGAASAVAAQPQAQAPGPEVAPTIERAIDQDTAFQVSLALAVELNAAGKVDTTELADSIDELGDSSSLPEHDVRALTRLMRASAADVTSQMSAYHAQVAAEKAAADAAAAAAAEAAAQAAAAEAFALANTPDGARATARSMAAGQYGWGDEQFSCLDSLWQKESNWNYQAYNADGGATGIPQALPGSKMASFGTDWESNATTQIAWGLDYISAVYATPCSAWGHSQSVNWY